MTVVSDTSPIHNPAAVGQLDLLRQLYDRVAIPRAVYQELLVAGEIDPGALAVQTLDWIEVRSISNPAQLRESGCVGEAAPKEHHSCQGDCPIESERPQCGRSPGISGGRVGNGSLAWIEGEDGSL